MMTQARKQIRLDFFLAWVTANIAAIAITTAGYMEFHSSFYTWIGAIAGEAATGAVTGIIVGLAQWIVLRRYFHTSIWWILTSVIGWAAVEIASIDVVQAIPYTTDIGVIGMWTLTGAMLGLSASILQMLLLPVQRRSIGLWLLFNTGGWAVTIAMGWPVGLVTATYHLWPGLLGVTQGILSGVVTGIAFIVSRLV